MYRPGKRGQGAGIYEKPYRFILPVAGQPAENTSAGKKTIKYSK